jgi:hypothetical protein
MSENQPHPLSLRLSPELKNRLEETAEKLGLKPHALAQLAVQAAVEAIEQNQNMLVLPVRFAADIKLDVTHVPAEKIRYPKGSIQPSALNEKRKPNSSAGTSDKTHKEIAEAGARAVPGAPPKKPKAP